MSEPLTTTTVLKSLMTMYASLGSNVELPPINELECLAKNIYFESKYEPQIGRQSVAFVTMTRVKSKHYPNTICGVVQQGYNPAKQHGCQFSWYCDKKTDNIHLIKSDNRINTERYEKFFQSAEDALMVYLDLVKDHTNGSTNYYAHNIITPKWAKNGKLEVQAKIGNHTFLKPK